MRLGAACAHDPRFERSPLFLASASLGQSIDTLTHIPAASLPRTRAFHAPPIHATNTFIYATNTFICAANTFIYATNTSICATHIFICATHASICATNKSICAANKSFCATNLTPPPSQARLLRAPAQGAARDLADAPSHVVRGPVARRPAPRLGGTSLMRESPPP